MFRNARFSLQERRSKIALAFIGLIAFATLLTFLLLPREPACEGKPLSHWLAELRNPDPVQQERARQALREIGPRAIPFLLRKARNEGSVLKRFYRGAWHRLPAALKRNLPPLKSKEDAFREISHALRQLGPSAIPLLMDAMEDTNSDVRFVLGGSFPHGGDEQARARWMIKLMETADYDHRQAAAAVLGLMGSDAAPAISTLLHAMQNDEIDYIRETAAGSLARLSLGGFGPETVTIAARLKESMNDPLGDVRLWAAIALWQINRDADVIPVLIGELANPSGERYGYVWCAILTVLGEAGPVANQAIPAIKASILEHPARGPLEYWGPVMEAAREALLKIDPEAAPLGDLPVP